MRFLVILVLLGVLVPEARADRFTFLPVSDNDDGQLVDGVAWDWRPLHATEDDALLTLGQDGATTYDNALGYTLPPLDEGQVVADARLRLNEQGGVITSGLTVRITAALDLDPLAAVGVARFSLPRTTAFLDWTIDAPFDSSGQRIAKYEESPDLAPVINEVLQQAGWDGGPRQILLFLELESAVGDNFVRYDDTHAAITGGNQGIDPPRLVVAETYRDAFWGRELLCRPHPDRVSVNVIPHADSEVQVEWGGDGVSFPSSGPVETVARGEAVNLEIGGLSPDTEYFYRLRSRPVAGVWETGPTRAFVTIPVGKSGVEARLVATTDIHVTNQLALGLTTQMDLLSNVMAAMPDHLAPQRYHAWLDLGDLVVVRAQRIVFDREETEQRYRTAREYIEAAAHSLPFVLVRGNHEEVNGWDDDGGTENTTVWSAEMLIKYFPPPVPDSFVSGNPVSHPVFGLPGNYFAFDVGPLRVRALDPYLFSLTRPHNGHGETGGSQDPWDWSLGQAQYDWLRQDLEQEPSPYSLLALHHLISSYDQPGGYYGRGGIEVAEWSVAGRPSFEWGGQDNSGADKMSMKRPGFSAGSIHDVLVQGGNQVVFKGHDHFHGRQQLDGMIYVTMAKPDDTGEHTGNLWGWRFNADYPGSETLFAENSGFYSIVADDAGATYEYVQTYPYPGFGNVVDSFTLLPAAPTDATELSSSPRLSWIRSVTPNPTRIAPRIELELGRRGPVRLEIVDVSGRRVRELLSEELPPGRHDVYWDAKDANGRRVGSGAYFARLSAGARVHSVKMIVLR